MKKAVSRHQFKNGKCIEAGIVTDKDKLEEVDDFYLKIGQDETHFRPDELVLIIKILSDTLLERVVGYEVNTGRLTKLDYKLKDFHK